MASLLDLAGTNPPATVTVGDVPVAVRGVSARALAVLMGRFAELRALLSGADIDIGVSTLLSLGPDVIASVIAAGTVGPRLRDGAWEIPVEAEDVAASLSIEDQAALLEAIVRKTFPGGPARFFERAAALVAAAGLAAPAPVEI
jgi:hypothetical protein